MCAYSIILSNKCQRKQRDTKNLKLGGVLGMCVGGGISPSKLSSTIVDVIAMRNIDKWCSEEIGELTAANDRGFFFFRKEILS